MKEIKQKIDPLIIGFLKSELSEAQTNQLTDWVKQDKENKNYFDEFIEIWLTNNASHDNSSRYDHQKGFAKFKEMVLNSSAVVKN